MPIYTLITTLKIEYPEGGWERRFLSYFPNMPLRTKARLG